MIWWEEYRWIVVLSLIVLLVIVLDELAYYGWKKMNPGHMYSYMFDKSGIPIVDPSRPPTTIYE